MMEISESDLMTKRRKLDDGTSDPTLPPYCSAPYPAGQPQKSAPTKQLFHIPEPASQRCQPTWCQGIVASHRPWSLHDQHRQVSSVFPEGFLLKLGRSCSDRLCRPLPVEGRLLMAWKRLIRRLERLRACIPFRVGISTKHKEPSLDVVTNSASRAHNVVLHPNATRSEKASSRTRFTRLKEVDEKLCQIPINPQRPCHDRLGERRNRRSPRQRWLIAHLM